jgi:hypothetical protein
MGKSTALETEAQDHQRVARDSGVTVLRADLRAYSTDQFLYSQVFDSPEMRTWKEGNGELVLYLDSLDEALLRIDTVAALIVDALGRLPTDRLSIRIACRTLVWPGAMLMPTFHRLWGKDAVGAFEIAPLSLSDVRAAAEVWPVDADAFLEQVRVANAVPFALKPLTLNLLLQLFETDGALPDSAADLYRRGCLSLCEEQSPQRRAAQRLGRLAPADRLQLAGRLAAVSMLANRYAIWTGMESGPVPAEDVPFSGLVVGTEPSASGRTEVTPAALREVLDTGLFSSRGQDRMGWAHQSYAEFLAADYLIASKVSPANVMSLLRHPSGGLVPQLEMVSAWAASLDQDIRRELIEREPDVVLHGDLSGWVPDDLAALADAYLRGLDGRRLHDFEFGLRNRYRKLAHAGLAAVLRPYVIDPSHDLVARRAAIEIAEACAVRDLGNELLSLAADQSVAPQIRARAVSALETCGDEQAWPVLRSLALDGAGPDPFCEIKGHALEALWPDRLDGEEMFRHLTPSPESYVGAYVQFITSRLPGSLKREDLPPALRWAVAFAQGATHAGNFYEKQLAGAIFRAAWHHVADPDILPLVLDYLEAVISTQHAVFFDVDLGANTDLRASIRADSTRRRALVRAALGTERPLTFPFMLRESGILSADDFVWLLSLSPTNGSAVDGIVETTLLGFVRAMLNLTEDAHFAALCDAAEHWPLLHSTYRGLLDGVELGSDEEATLREYHRLETSSARRERELLIPPPRERVRTLLERFEGGNNDAWWQLNRELTLEPASTHYGVDHDYLITGTPGWGEADEGIQALILAAAENFLDRTTPTVDRWIETNEYNLNDFAAYRAVLLIRELLPERYRELTPGLWQKWAAIVFAVPRESGTPDAVLHDAVLAEVAAAAPAEVASAVVRIIHGERQRRLAETTPSPQELSAFSVLRELDPIHENQLLVIGLLQELDDDRNTPAQYAAILEFLLKGNVEAANERVASLLGTWPCGAERRQLAVTAAATLLTHDPRAGWPVVWPVLAQDTDFGRELFLGIGYRHRMDADLFAGLTEDQLGDLYIWLAQQFPHRDDTNAAGVHWLGPRQAVVHLRDGILQLIVNRGTPAAVDAIRSAMARLPELDWLVYRLMDADKLMRRRSWLPPTPAELLRLVDRPDGRLVQSAEELAAVLVSSLRKYERELHGEQTPVRLLWDRQQGGRLLRPVEEDAISDDVKRFLQRELVDRGIVLNREVEVGRAPGAPIGTRTDIRVNAVKRGTDGESFDMITAVIETKGCWNAELSTAMQSQLRDGYLTRLAAPVGIYLVGWFDQRSWDPEDGRRAQSPPWDAAAAQRELDKQAKELSNGFIVRAVVLDCHAPQAAGPRSRKPRAKRKS